MNILMVVHQFLPLHLAGSEVYTYRLAQALMARGHRVQLFFTEIRTDRPQYEMTRGVYDGIPYFEAVHNRSFPSFRHTYADPKMEQLFSKVLDEAASELVHIQHLFLHSIGYIDIVRRRRLPMVYTIHEYMLMCLNNGLLLRPGTEPCVGPETDACAQCAAVSYPDVPLERQASRLPSLSRMFEKAGNRLGFRNASFTGKGGRNGYAAAIQRRRTETQAELDKVDLFVAPSRFLRQRFVDEGMIRADRIIYSDYGSFVEPFSRVRRVPSPVLRAGYVGTISDYKGVHLIVEAFQQLRDAGIECRIYGNLDTFPDYKKRLLDLGTPPGIRYMGRIENGNVSEALQDLDVLIVPSLWPENSPLTIHEAYLAGIPVVTSDCGGMAELVEHGRTGLHFRRGDAADLRRQLQRLHGEPRLLESMGRHIPAVKTIEEDAAQMEDRYRLLLEVKRIEK